MPSLSYQISYSEQRFNNNSVYLFESAADIIRSEYLLFCSNPFSDEIRCWNLYPNIPAFIIHIKYDRYYIHTLNLITNPLLSIVIRFFALTKM